MIHFNYENRPDSGVVLGVDETSAGESDASDRSQSFWRYAKSKASRARGTNAQNLSETGIFLGENGHRLWICTSKQYKCIKTFQEADNRVDFDGEVPSSSRDTPIPSPRPLWSMKSTLSPMAGVSPALSPAPAPSTPLPSVDSGDEETLGSAGCLPVTTLIGKRARIRLFPQKWLGDYPWLAYDAAEKTMHRRLCKELGKKTLMGMRSDEWNEEFSDSYPNRPCAIGRPSSCSGC